MRDEEAPGPVTPASAPTAPGRLGREDARGSGDETPHTRFFLIRHAEVENPHRVLYGHLDGFHLSALGRAQAAAVGAELREAGLTHIVHSPLERAVGTARVIAHPMTPRPALAAGPPPPEAQVSRD